MISKLYNDDFRNVAKNITDGSIDIILTDPPYLVNTKLISRSRTNVKYKKLQYYNDKMTEKSGNKEMIQQFFRMCNDKLKNDGILLFFISHQNLAQFINWGKNAGLNYYYLITWIKNNIKCNQHQTNPDVMCEYIVAFYKKEKPKHNPDLNFRDAIFFDNVVGRFKNHPNEKPAPLLDYLIKSYCFDKDRTYTILDPFMGGGSLGSVVKYIDNVEYVGIEKNEDFFKNANDKIYHNKENSYIITEETSNILYYM